MKPAELQAVLDANDVDACIALFATASEADRRAVAKGAAALLREIHSGVPLQVASILVNFSDEQIEGFYPGMAARRVGLRVAQVAVLATATLGELKKFGERCFPPIDDAVAVLSARRPPWVGEWAEAIISWGGRNASWIGTAVRWPFVRRLVREGLCARPRGTQYIQGMISGIVPPHGGDIRTALLGDPALLEADVWEIFETEPTRGMYGLLPIGGWTDPTHRWEVALAGLAADGYLSRARLLDASLGGLARDFHETRTRWFALMHETLEPTLDERAERAGRYVGLLANHNASTVAFALKALAVLESADRLELGPLIDAAGPALLARAKGTVLSALKLIDRAARRSPALRSRAAALAVDALAHEAPAVHEAVVDLIERHGDRTDRGLADILCPRLDTVAASQRARLAAWLVPTTPAVSTAVDNSAVDDLLARACSLIPRFAKPAGVAVAIEFLTQGSGDVPAIDFSEMQAPRLNPDRAVIPVADLDDLIALFSSILEHREDVDDLERVLDGVSRLCDRVPDDFPTRTGPLRARAEEYDRMPMHQIRSHLIRPLCDLARGWITGHTVEVKFANHQESFTGIFARRTLAVVRRAAERQAAPLLSAPTHLGGWIDPRALVQRVEFWASSTLRLDRLDGALALLRLAPDSGPRAEALCLAAELEGPYSAALRYALGGDGERVGPDFRIWVAAARARAPSEDDARVEARHPGLGPDAGRGARCSLLPGPHSSRDWFTMSRHPVIQCEPALPASVQRDLPTVLMHDARAYGGAADRRWVATIWPLCRESFFAAGADWLLGLECNPSVVRIYQPFLEELLDPDTPLGPMARLLLAGALSSIRPELQGLATDALIAAVDDGRMDGGRLGGTLHCLFTGGLVKPNRLAKALRDAARVSPLHARVAAQALERALVGSAERHRDLHILLELLKELLIGIGERLSDPTVMTFLRGLKISGKTAKLVQDLLALPEEPNPASRSLAASRALAGRVERAERWIRVATAK
jgi:hypothetical protein